MLSGKAIRPRRDRLQSSTTAVAGLCEAGMGHRGIRDIHVAQCCPGRQSGLAETGYRSGVFVAGLCEAGMGHRGIRDIHLAQCCPEIQSGLAETGYGRSR